MHRTRKFLATAGLKLAFLLTLANITLADNAELRARFMSDAPKGWSQAAALAQQLDIECTQRQLRPNLEQETRISVKVSGENALEISTNLKTLANAKTRRGGKQLVACRNSTYSFSLEKSDENGPWFVTFVGPQNGMQKQLAHVDSLALFPLFAYNRNLIEWFQSPNFAVKDVEWAERPSGKLVAVAFACTKDATEKYWIHDGVLYLNPDRLWTIQELKFDATTGKGDEEHVSQDTKFRADAANLPLMEASVISADTKVGRVQVTTDFKRFEHRQIPEEEFMLAAFGLPEIHRPSSLWARGRLWFVLVGAGILCLVVAIVLRRRVAT